MAAVITSLHDRLDDCEKESTRFAAVLLKSEQDKPFTQQEGFQEKLEYEQSRQAPNKAQRYSHECVHQSCQQFAYCMCRDDDYPVPIQPTASVVKEMQATVITYTNIMWNRISDVIPMLLRHHFPDHITENLFPWLVHDCHDADRLAELMEEDEAIKTRRGELDDSIKRLQAAMRELNRLQKI